MPGLGCQGLQHLAQGLSCLADQLLAHLVRVGVRDRAGVGNRAEVGSVLGVGFE